MATFAVAIRSAEDSGHTPESIVEQFAVGASPVEEHSAQLPLPATVNHGRWIVTCECGSAQNAHRTVQRFFCVECHNHSVDGFWRPVLWPAPPDVQQIEQILGARPLRQFRSWHPGESIKSLADDNIAHGIGI